MTLNALNIRSVLESPPEPLDFVLPGLLSGTVGSIVGAGAVGKTTFLLQLAMSLSANLSMAGGVFAAPGKAGRVVLLAAEESSKILTPRLHAIAEHICTAKRPGSGRAGTDAPTAMGMWETNLAIVPGTGESVYLLKEGLHTEFFEALCEFCAGARLVIVDPLRRLHDGDENNSAEMTEVVQALEKIAKRTGAAVIVAHHANKAAQFNGSSESAGASRGSSALTDAVRWQLNLSCMTETEAKAHGVVGDHKSYVRVDFAKTNYLPPQQTIWMRRLEGGVLERVELSNTPPSSARRARRSESQPGDAEYV